MLRTNLNASVDFSFLLVCSDLLQIRDIELFLGISHRDRPGLIDPFNIFQIGLAGIEKVTIRIDRRIHRRRMRRIMSVLKNLQKNHLRKDRQSQSRIQYSFSLDQIILWCL